MPGLLELGPMTREVTVMGQPLTLHPISVENLIKLWSQFPVLVQLLEGHSTDEAIKIIGPVAIAHVIACATGDMEKPEAIEAAMHIGVGKVAEIIEQIIEITFEDGTAPFLARIEKNSANSMPLVSMVSRQESSVPWSASLEGDELSPMHSPLRRVS